MSKIIIDGKELEFKQGQTIIQVALENGIDIPHFCWHPSLSVSGNCRVCLVEVEKMPKLVIACSTLAAEGMVVHTVSEKAIAARNAVMEFILINHPLDCPICDEAGECKLQDYAYQHSVGESRFTEEKMHKDKRVPLGPYVMFDGERCISCSRCIRFCDEIAGETQLTFVKRGDRVTIETFPGKQLDNPYSLNVTDICPVGALTNRDFRFKSRVWDMSSTKSICTGCSRGCNIEIWVRSNEIFRLTPRFNPSVNSYWMCDYGRIETFKNVNAVDRVNGPHIKREGELTRVGWDEAFAYSVSELKGFNKDEVAFIASSFSTCEDNYLLSRFAKSVLGTKNIAVPEHIIPGSGDNILIREEKSPNYYGAVLTGLIDKNSKDINTILQKIEDGKIKALYVVEENIVALYPEYKSAFDKLELLVVHSTNRNETTALADILFPASAYAEKNGTWINFEGRIQRIRPAVATLDSDRTLDGMELSRLDKFGTSYDRWGNIKKVDARSTWRIFGGLFSALGNKLKFNSADEVFEEMSRTIPELKNIDYDEIGEQGIQLQFQLKTEKV
ncbi:MAG TPA: molybdopterin-dependent oxidoreductase [Ignavibacteriaceae bacterium]|nr:molybdopterin-dependent oxidoreductase [Ignavibacteriaceae bacterium]